MSNKKHPLSEKEVVDAVQSLFVRFHENGAQDIVHPSPDVATLIDEACGYARNEGSGFPLSSVAVFSRQSTGLVWEPDYAFNLEEFLYEKFNDNDAKVEARIKALEKGQPPTEDELAHFKILYEEGELDVEVAGQYPNFHLLKASSEELVAPGRFIYVVSERVEMGPYSDQQTAFGPFSSLEGVANWFVSTFPAFSFQWFSEDSPADAHSFKEKLRALGASV